MTLLATIGSSGDKFAPNAPTIGTATDVGSGRTFVSGGRADVTFTAPTVTGRSPIVSYTVTSNTGGFTGTGSASPISVTGLTPGNAYTFTVTATNAAGFTSAASSASNSITATTIPQVPTITSATRTSNTAVSIAFTGSTGGASLSAVTATSSPSVSITSSGTSSPMTATATYAQSTAYTFTITATNANGTSTASNTSSSVTPNPAPAIQTWAIATNYPSSLTYIRGSSAGAGWVASGGSSSTAGPSGSGTSYYWNGSAFTNQSGGLQAHVFSVIRGDASGNVQLNGFWTYSGGEPQGGSTSTYYITVGSSTFTSGAAIPTSEGGYIGASNSWGTNIFSVSQTSSGNKYIYYRTGTGAFTTSGTQFPWGYASASGSPFFSTTGKSYVADGATFYSGTTPNGTFAVETAWPRSTVQAAYTSLTKSNNSLFLYDGKDNNDTITPYRYNSNSTWTVQTVLTTAIGWARQMMLGYDNGMSVAAGDTNPGGNGTNTHYKATVS